MLKEQLLSLAMKAYSQAYEVKERIKNSMKNEAANSYVRSIGYVAIKIWEKHWPKLGSSDCDSVTSGPKDQESFIDHSKRAINLNKNGKATIKKTRKSSIKPAKEIDSLRADIILQKLKKNNCRMIANNDEVDGKRSLAYLVWALGHAEQANINEGISVHDVSALLYRSCKIELYPINISRVMYGNPALVRQAGQEKRTKTYLLTDEGAVLFKEKFL